MAAPAPLPAMTAADLLYTDRQLVVCVKPVGLIAEQGGEETVPGQLAGLLGGSAADYRPIHRLDRAVGGVTVYARTKAAAAHLSRQVEQQTVTKRYLAVLPAPPQPPEGELRDYLFRDSARGKAFPVSGPRKGAKPAVLTYRTLSVSAEGPALVSVSLQTGRFHQIRCQFAARRLPLLGDGKYGSRVKACTPALWCHTLGFVHPGTGQPAEFTAPPPAQYPWTLFEGGLF